MQDVTQQLEKLLADAADCDLIASLAADPSTRRKFAEIAAHLRQRVSEAAGELATAKQQPRTVSAQFRAT
jgi:hypothetical protein